VKNDRQLFGLVIMPFSKEFDDRYQLGIKEVANSLDISVERLDEQIFTEGMMERLYSQILAADFIIADLSERNPNVYYELGYSHAKNKTCILLTSDANDIPFDLRNYRHIVYEDSLVKLQKEIGCELNFIKGLIEGRATKINMECSINLVNLVETDYSVRANIELGIDVYNQLNDQSIEVNGIYLYFSDDSWALVQSDIECSKIHSDIEGFAIRFFIKPPLKVLGAGAWMPCKIIGSRVFKNKWDVSTDNSDKFVTESCLLRLTTDSQPIDINFEVVIDESEVKI